MSTVSKPLPVPPAIEWRRHLMATLPSGRVLVVSQNGEWKIAGPDPKTQDLHVRAPTMEQAQRAAERYAASKERVDKVAWAHMQLAEPVPGLHAVIDHAEGVGFAWSLLVADQPIDCELEPTPEGARAAIEAALLSWFLLKPQALRRLLAQAGRDA